MGTPPSNQSNAQRLQDLRNENEQLVLRLERYQGIEETVATLTAELAAERAVVATDPQLVAQVRNLREALLLAEQDKAVMERRVIAAGHDIVTLNARLGQVRDLIRGKDCLLPQIAKIVG